MIAKLSKSIALFLCEKKVINYDDIVIYEYGNEVIISTLIGFILIMSVGIILEELVSTIVFYIVFVLVRLFTGGYHANTHFKCKSVMVCCCLFVLLLSKLYISLYVVFLLNLIYFFSVILFVPIEHINAPLSKEKKKRNRLISIIMAIFIIIANVTTFGCFPKLSAVVALTLFIIAVLIFIPKIFRKEKLFYEKEE